MQSTRWAPCVLGASYGLALACGALLTALTGDGPYLLWGIFSAPLGPLGYGAALYGTPFLWAAAGYLAGGVGIQARRRGLVAVLGAHYVGILFALSSPQYANWPLVREHLTFPVARAVTIGFIATYLAGQAVLWLRLLRGFSGKAPVLRDDN
jgi:hypothetical protein